MEKCETCKHAVITTSYNVNTVYIGCQLQEADAEKMTKKQLLYVIKHPEEGRCEYVKGKPQDGGVTFDD